MRTDMAYQIITDRIVTLLEHGTIPWQQPWRGGAGGMPRNLVSGKPYRGINVFMLGNTFANYEKLKEGGVA